MESGYNLTPWVRNGSGEKPISLGYTLYMNLESIKQLVEQIATVMGPALPGLLSKGGEEMAKSVAGALGKDLWDEAKQLWKGILPAAQ